jgi:alpha-galactosidase
MAWRSWNAFHNGISSAIIEAQIDAMTVRDRKVIGRAGNTSLLDIGYSTCGIDEGWEACGKGINGTQHDANGNPVVDSVKFPDLGRLVTYGHIKSMHMGFYLNGCACGERKELRINYEGDVRALAAFDFDAVKIDSCGAQKNMSLYAELMNETGRRFLIENCHQGQNFPDGGNPYFAHASGPGEWCPYNIFRTSGDIVNLWDRVMSNLQSTQQFLLPDHGKGRVGQSLARPGCFAYPDMLEVGRMASLAEDASHFAAWCISSSPLVLGFDLRNATKLDRVWDIITNEVAVNISQTAVAVADVEAGKARQAFPAGIGSSGGLVAGFFAENLPTVVAEPSRSGSCLHQPPPADGFSHVRNTALTANHELFGGNYTLQQAEALCEANSLCTGFTFEGNATGGEDPALLRSTYFKSANVLSTDPAWQSYLKYDPRTAANITGWGLGLDGSRGLLRVPGGGLCLDSAAQLPQPGYPNWIRTVGCDPASPTQQWQKRGNASALQLFSVAAQQCLGVTRHWLWNGAPVPSLGGCSSSSYDATAFLYEEEPPPSPSPPGTTGGGTLRSTTGPAYCLGVSRFSGPQSQVWAKPLDAAGKMAVLAINGAELPHQAVVHFSQLSNSSATFTVYDVWARKDLGVMSGSVAQHVAAHGSMFLIVTPVADA